MTIQTISTAEEKSTNAETPASVVEIIRDPPKKARSTKKLVLIAVTVVLCLGLVVAAVLVTLKLVLDADIAIVQYTVSKSINGQSANETVAVHGNIVTRSVVTSVYTAWVVEDYDKSIQVVKIQSSGGVICYVSALNRSDSYDAISAIASSPPSTNSTPDEVRSYTALGDPIPDISYLGTTASEMCSNVPTYWAMPQCADSGAVGGIRRKRQTAIRCCATCSCICLRCFPIRCYYLCCYSCPIILYPDYPIPVPGPDPGPVINPVVDPVVAT